MALSIPAAARALALAATALKVARDGAAAWREMRRDDGRRTEMQRKNEMSRTLADGGTLKLTRAPQRWDVAVVPADPGAGVEEIVSGATRAEALDAFADVLRDDVMERRGLE